MLMLKVRMLIGTKMTTFFNIIGVITPYGKISNNFDFLGYVRKRE